LSSNPNLQNIPIRTAFSRQIRKAFLQNRAGCWWQLIIRKLNCGFWLILVRTGVGGGVPERRDIHTVTARLLFEKETVTPDERRLAKTINFGVIWHGRAAVCAKQG